MIVLDSHTYLNMDSYPAYHAPSPIREPTLDEVKGMERHKATLDQWRQVTRLQ